MLPTFKDHLEVWEVEGIGGGGAPGPLTHHRNGARCYFSVIIYLFPIISTYAFILELFFLSLINLRQAKVRLDHLVTKYNIIGLST